MNTIETADRLSLRRMTTDEIRDHFVIDTLFVPGRIQLTYTDVDRAVVGGVMPTDTPLHLEGGKEMACDAFCDRREVGIINLALTSGVVTVDGDAYPLLARECLYIGKGAKAITFTSDDATAPAQFYLVSYPAHTTYPTRKATQKDANVVNLGSDKEANRRTIYQYIRPGFIESCQLVMGYTSLYEGNVWNTFPPHTHDRRTEVYCYFDLPPNGLVIHCLGEPSETRHVVLREKEATLSPAWSIHSGVGTGAYAFVWAMGGENQVFEDMDPCHLPDVK